MKQLVMVGLVGLACACGGRGNNGNVPPPGEPVVSFGQWQFGGKTYYSVHDLNPAGGIVVVEPAHVWRCNLQGGDCTNIDTCVTFPGPSLTGSGSSTTGSSPNGSSAAGSSGSGTSIGIPVACPQVCNCMGTDCNYYCGNSIIDKTHPPLQLPPPAPDKPAP